MLWQSRTGASAEVHTYVEAVRFYSQGQRFLRFPNELCHFENFSFFGRVQVGYVANWRDK